MADLIVRPDPTRPSTARDARPDNPAVLDTITPREDSLAERLITTQSPQRPQSTPRIRIEVDGRVVEGFEGQTILEVCRDNGIEIPTLCYEPKLPGFGACRMCVCEVEGEDQPPISCSRAAEPGMVVQTQTDELRRLRRTNLELSSRDHNAYCLPPCQNKCPSHIDIPGFLKANAEANWRSPPGSSSARSRSPACSAACAPPRARSTAARRGRRGDRDPRQPPLRRRPGHQGDARRGHRPAAPVRDAGRRPAAAPRSSAPARPDGRRLLPAAGRPRRDRLRARPGARRHAPLRHPAVPPAQGRGPRGRVRVGRSGSAARSSATRAGQGLHARRPPEPAASTASSSRSAATTRTSSASPTRTPTASSTASSTCAPRRSA